jgi:two-component sensor histidine kinase
MDPLVQEPAADRFHALLAHASAEALDAFAEAVERGCERTGASVDSALLSAADHLAAADGSSPAGAETSLREMQHRMINQLAVLAGVMRVRRRSGIADRRIPPCASCIAQVTALARLHQTLGAGASSGEVELRSHLLGVCELLRQSFSLGDRVFIDVAGPELKVCESEASTLALIVNEAVTNSVKHGFSGQRPGWIRVELEADGGALSRLRIVDNGDGQGGTATPGGGLTLVERLAESLGGHVTRPATPDGFVLDVAFARSARVQLRVRGSRP